VTQSIGSGAPGARAVEALEPHASGVGRSEIERVPASPAFRFCRDADTVIEGFACAEPAVVSNACRKPTNAVDAYICDEPRMRALQTVVTDTAVWCLKVLLFRWLLGGSR
jgi:hypothetical protein